MCTTLLVEILTEIPRRQRERSAYYSKPKMSPLTAAAVYDYLERMSRDEADPSVFDEYRSARGGSRGPGSRVQSPGFRSQMSVPHEADEGNDYDSNAQERGDEEEILPVVRNHAFL